jgi:thiol-disulfide isomerase/thioredoxin
MYRIDEVFLFICVSFIFILVIEINAQPTLPDHSGEYFELSFIDALSGEYIDTKTMRNKIIIVNFWYSECSPCQSLMPHIKNMTDEYSSELVQFIGINIDEDKTKFLKHCDEENIDWPQFFEDDKKWDTSVALEWQVEMVPMLFFINRDGIIVESTVDINLIDTLIQKEIKGSTER